MKITFLISGRTSVWVYPTGRYSYQKPSCR